MRKYFILFTVLIIIFLSACKSILIFRYNDDDKLKHLKYDEVKFLVSESFIRGGFSEYRDQIVEEFQKLALEKTNTNVRLVFAEETVYAEVLQLRINTGLDFDMFLGFEVMQSDRMLAGMFKTSEYWINKGYALDLTDRISDYENLNNRFERYPILRELGTYNGRLYALPSGIQKSDRPYILVRDDLWEQFGSDKNIETLEDIYTFMINVNNSHNEPFYVKTLFNLYDFIEIFARESGYYMLPGAYVAKITDTEIQPIPIETTDILDKACDYYMRMDKNSILLELDESTEVSTILSGTKTAIYLSGNPEEYHYETAGNLPYQYTFQSMYPQIGFDIKVPSEVNLMIYKESKSSDRALTILDWLGTSNQAYDLLAYGIEKINYKYANKQFIFDNTTVPALGWMQRINGYPELEKNFSTDKTDYNRVIIANLEKAYINPLNMLLLCNQSNMTKYLDQTRLNASLFGSRTNIVSGYVKIASRSQPLDVESFKKSLSQQDNKLIEQTLNSIMEALKNNVQ